MNFVPFADRKRSGSDGGLERRFLGHIIAFDVAVMRMPQRLPTGMIAYVASPMSLPHVNGFRTSLRTEAIALQGESSGPRITCGEYSAANSAVNNLSNTDTGILKR
jgi:hypothetical protein